MLFCDCEVRPSDIEGMGVYSNQSIPQGAAVGCLIFGCTVISELDYCSEQSRGNIDVIKTGIRLVSDKFIYNQSVGARAGEFFQDEDYLNHSTNPNLLYHCGILFALRDIDLGEELSIDYKFLMAQNDCTTFPDRLTGKSVACLTGSQALLESTQQLLRLLSSETLSNNNESDRKRGDALRLGPLNSISKAA